MTGYARVDGAGDGIAWTWEAKSVNGRGLDVRCRLPPGMDSFEPSVRSALSGRMARGSVSVSLAVSRPDGAVRPHVNREFLDSLLEMARSYAAAAGAPPPRLEALLSVRGVIETAEREETEAEREERAGAILGSFDRVAEELVDARRREGEHLEAIVRERLAEIEALMSEAAGLASLQPGKLRTRLAEQIRELAGEAPAVTDDRVAQEIALLLTKYDVREELDRIAAHLAQAWALVEAGGAVGRRLDFLAQELNREANTVCAKAADNELSRVGLELKTVIDRLREQAQNLE